MKKLIRNWLGIKDISNTDVLEQVERIVFGETFINNISERIANKLKWREELHLTSHARQQAQLEIKNTIGTEKFIDDVVARIKNKQI